MNKLNCDRLVSFNFCDLCARYMVRKFTSSSQIMAKNIDISLRLAVYLLHKTGFAFVFHKFLHVPHPKSI